MIPLVTVYPQYSIPGHAQRCSECQTPLHSRWLVQHRKNSCHLCSTHSSRQDWRDCICKNKKVNLCQSFFVVLKVSYRKQYRIQFLHFQYFAFERDCEKSKKWQELDHHENYWIKGNFLISCAAPDHRY